MGRVTFFFGVEESDRFFWGGKKVIVFFFVGRVIVFFGERGREGKSVRFFLWEE